MRHGSRRPRRPRRLDEGALARERAFLGALVLEPAVILWFALRRPPWSFLDPRSVDVMRALVCLVRSKATVTIENIILVLDHHEALTRVGGRSYVESLVVPRTELDEARKRLREKFVPVEREPIVEFAKKLLGGEPPEGGP
jgi:hypothetical protein